MSAHWNTVLSNNIFSVTYIFFQDLQLCLLDFGPCSWLFFIEVHSKIQVFIIRIDELCWYLIMFKAIFIFRCWWGYSLSKYFWILEAPRMLVIAVSITFLIIPLHSESNQCKYYALISITKVIRSVFYYDIIILTLNHELLQDFGTIRTSNSWFPHPMALYP